VGVPISCISSRLVTEASEITQNGHEAHQQFCISGHSLDHASKVGVPMSCISSRLVTEASEITQNGHEAHQQQR
jgi:hypothetical protein